jgi:pimeloyl-ACP methyl ester carboxylesterase
MSNIDSGVIPSFDHVEIAYSTCGQGTLSLVFIHGGLANRRFFGGQLEALSRRFQVVALDLAGHGDSGRDRATYSMPAFAGDVRAVADALALSRIVLAGNSLGGPVALEAAALLGRRVLGVVGIDTFHDLTAVMDAGAGRARAEAFERDPVGSLHAMVTQLFHPGAHPELQAWAEAEMARTPSWVVVPMLLSFAGYDVATAARRAGAPVRALNGDLWPTLTEKNQTVVPDFSVSVMPDAGHYPMLEQPARFNERLESIVDELR